MHTRGQHATYVRNSPSSRTRSMSAKKCGRQTSSPSSPRHGANPRKHQLPARRWRQWRISILETCRQEKGGSHLGSSGLVGKSRDRFPRGIIPDCERGDRAHPPTPLGIHLCCFSPRIRQSLRAMRGSGRRKATTLRPAFRKSWLFLARFVGADMLPPAPGPFGLARPHSRHLSPFWVQIFHDLIHPLDPHTCFAMNTNRDELTTAPSFLTQMRCHGLVCARSETKYLDGARVSQAQHHMRGNGNIKNSGV